MGVGGGGHAAPEPRAVAGAEGCARPRAPPPASPPGKGWGGGQGRGSSPRQGFAAKRPHPHRFCSLQAPRSHFCGRGAGQVLFLGQVSEARWPGLGGRPLGEEPGASEVRGVKGAGGRRRLCGRGVGAWPSGPRMCATGARPASLGAARPPGPPRPEPGPLSGAESEARPRGGGPAALAGEQGWHLGTPLSTDWRKAQRPPATGQFPPLDDTDSPGPGVPTTVPEAGPGLEGCTFQTEWAPQPASQGQGERRPLLC